MFVFVIGTTLLTKTFGFLGVVFIQKSWHTPAESIAIDEKTAKLVSEPPPSTLAPNSIQNLFWLVISAEWEKILDIAQSRPRIGYWKLYRHIATFILSQDSRKKHKSMVRARSWVRLLSMITRITPKLVNRNKGLHEVLIWDAESLIMVEFQRMDFSTKLTQPDMDRISMLDISLARFNIALMEPLHYGIDRMYSDIREDIRDIMQQSKNLDIEDRIEIRNRLSDSDDPYGTDETALEKVQSKFKKFIKEANIEFVDYRIFQVSTEAINLGRDMLKEAESLPDGTPAKLSAIEFAVRAYCVAAASICNEIKQESLGLYADIMADLCDLALSQYQGLATCILISEYQKVINPFLPEIEEIDTDLAEYLKNKFTDLRAQVEEIRGAPCPDMAHI